MPTPSNYDQMSPDVQALIATAFSSQVFASGALDVQHTPLYDTLSFAAGANVTSGSTFFDNVGSASGKTYAQTNMEQSRRLPAPEAFAVLGIRVLYQANTAGQTPLLSDIIQIQQNFALEFWLGQKYYHRAPLWTLSPGGGIWGFAAAATTVAATTINTVSANNGSPSRSDMHRLSIPLTIETNGTFYARLVGTSSITLAAAGATGGQGIQIMCLLEGLYARGIQ